LTCSACESQQELVYESTTESSVTSICSVLRTALEARLCTACALVQTAHNPSISLGAFWEEYHSIQAQSTDPVYLKDGERVVFRAEHEAALLEKMLGLATGVRIAILGGVRAESARVLQIHRPDLVFHVVLESAVYAERFAFVPSDQIVVQDIPAEWNGIFDAVVSLYDLVHESDPVPHLAAMTDLLKPDGRVFLAVPNLATNTGDLVVANHFSHFTADSLRTLLQSHQWAEVRVDEEVFNGRLVAVATKALATHHSIHPIASETFSTIRRICRYWKDFGERVRAFENAQAEAPAAIYGAGFYGAFILSQLRTPERIESFFDGNVGLAGKRIASIPVCVPSRQAIENAVLYLGLNPEIAASVGGNLHRDGLPTFFP
jgi:SAM-dependent methyltransferase